MIESKCPWCGELTAAERGDIYGFPTSWQWRCDVCGARGPGRDTQAGALATLADVRPNTTSHIIAAHTGEIARANKAEAALAELREALDAMVGQHMHLRGLMSLPMDGRSGVRYYVMMIDGRSMMPDEIGGGHDHSADAVLAWWRARR